MSAWDWDSGHGMRTWFLRRLGAPLALMMVCSAAIAFDEDGLSAEDPARTAAWPSVVIPGQPEVSAIYADGSVVTVDTEDRWKFMCGSNLAGQTAEDLADFAANHIQAIETGPITVVDSRTRSGGLNIVFNTDSSVPYYAINGLAIAEAYLESMFGDDITITIDVTFQSMGGNVIGATSSSYVNGVTYSSSRSGLLGGMDADDIIQSWLPTGSSVPVRYNGSSSSVTYEHYVSWTKAAYRSTVGSVSGTAASMTFNTDFSFDYNPANGVSYNKMSFVDIMIHEVGHALGFTSATDWGSYLTALDLYRFQNTDGSGDYNPDTYQEFQARARLVDYNNPDDNHISDLIDVEYRMSDGSPWQGSHFREQSSPWIGLMDPAFSYGETHYPNYYSSADLNMFDAIGYDYPPCVPPQFLQQPTPSQSVCGGETVQLSVTVDLTSAIYQWRKGTTDLVDDGVHILGATTDTLTIADVTTGDQATYSCVVTNPADGCVRTSDDAHLYVTAAAEVIQQPQDQTVEVGAQVNITVEATGDNLTYQWRHDGVPLTSGVDGYFATNTPSLLIGAAWPMHAGEYDVVITNSCGTLTSDAATLTVLYFTVGDLNCDGLVDFDDINPFVLALGGEGGYVAEFPECNWLSADVDGDGDVDFDDITPFVDLLSGD